MNLPSLPRSPVRGLQALKAVLFACLLAVGLTDSALADPPCWAPAHGYRAKHGNKGCDKHYRKHHKAKRYQYETPEDGYRRDERNAHKTTADAVSAGGLVGAAVGGYAGSKVGKGSGKLAATAGGAVAGYIVGQELERELTDPAR